MLASDPTDSSIKIILMGDLVHRMRNNIGFPNKNSNIEGVDTSFNTWDLGVMPAETHFASVDDTGLMGLRESDGSLPDTDFMKLTPKGPMIDTGTDVGLPFAGAAPDVGAFEHGLVSAGGTTGAGAAGTSGSSSVGGNAGSESGGVSGVGGTSSAGGTGSTVNGGTRSSGTAGVSSGTGGTASAAPGTSGGESAHDSGCGCRQAGTRSPDQRLESFALIGSAIAMWRRRAGHSQCR